MASKIFSAASGESSSKRYFTEKLLVTEACSDVSDAENRDPWNPPQVMHVIISVWSAGWPLIHLKHGVAT